MSTVTNDVDVPIDWHDDSHGNRVFWFDAFLSHRTNDRSALVADQLAQRGVRVWHDESASMQDAQWAMRITRGLLASRHVVLVLDTDRAITQRPWIQAECESARDAQTLCGVDRLLAVRFEPNNAIPFGIDSAHLFVADANGLDVLANRLLANNRVQLDTAAPSLPYLEETEAVLNSTAKSNGSLPEIWVWLLEFLREGIRETIRDRSRPSQGLYRAWLWAASTAGLPPAERAVVSAITQALEVLACVGHNESRANACIALGRLDSKGITGAGDALIRAAKRERHAGTMTLMLNLLAETGAPKDRARRIDQTLAVLIALVAGNDLDDREWEIIEPLLGATSTASTLRLRQSVRRTTAATVYRVLRARSGAGEPASRFAQLRSSGSATEWDLFFRALSRLAGCSKSHFDIAALNRHAASELVGFVGLLLAEVQPRQRHYLWNMHYETAILTPLAAASVLEDLRGRARSTYNTYLDMIIEELSRRLRTCDVLAAGNALKEFSDAEIAVALELERNSLMHERALAMLFRTGPVLQRDGDWVTVLLYRPSPDVNLLENEISGFSDRARRIEAICGSQYPKTGLIRERFAVAYDAPAASLR